MTQQPWGQQAPQQYPQQYVTQQPGQPAVTTSAVQAPDAATMFDNVGNQLPASSYAFGDVGDFIEGEVDSTYATVVTDTSGNIKYYPPKPGRPATPIPQLNVTIQTHYRNWEKSKKQPTRKNAQNQDEPIPASEDTGLRRIYVKYDMLRAVGVALREAGVPGGVGVQNGAKIRVTLTGFKPTSQPNPLPLYEARYAKPAVSDSAGFFAQPAVQQQLQPAEALHGYQGAPDQQHRQQPAAPQQAPAVGQDPWATQPPAPPAPGSPWNAPQQNAPTDPSF